ncbi:phytanoyl-CoA dioxygenase family protein [Fibrella forsythiae]|uniref:Phytanoyl-CoA dioxygenase family protein n=1 Tax=Fibrella forsythiae TaxID=2817061 RepID=A0ABS3JM24_9BACT|nr:phytanoyl-CoA dioxygenase family protein [Fibrella forsythiae]MBO0951057.1 phytanoyl-CoA dioxygenase family protein [Fibrella forsythiae]
MTKTSLDLVASTVTSQLGILHLKRYWAKKMAIRQGQLASNAFEEETHLDSALLNALGLGLEPTIQYLFQVSPSFPDFEAWIQLVTGGLVNRDKIDTFNARLLGTTLAESSDPATEPTLSGADLLHWDTHGYVIIKEAISRQDCEETIGLICDFLGIDRYDPQTWYTPHTARQGIMVQLFTHALLTKNRESPRIRAAYEQLWGRRDLWVSHDRVGFNPPQTDSWPFPGPHLHWDVRLDRPVSFGLQGLLYLSDTQVNQGAFTLVPGFQHQLTHWLAQLPPRADPQTQDLGALGAIPLAGAAGDFILWHHALPHGSSPNLAAAPRFVQYINYAP